MVAIHKKRLGKIRATVDDIQNKHEVWQPRHHDFVDGGFFFRQQINSHQHRGDEERAYARNLFRGIPEDLFVPFDEQLVEVFESFAVAGNRGIRRYFLFVCLLDDLDCHLRIHLVGKAGEQFLVDAAIIAEGQHLRQANRSQGNAGQKYGHGYRGWHNHPEGRQGVSDQQKQGDAAPYVFRQLVFVIAKAPFFIIPQRSGRHKQLHAHDTKRQEQAKPQGQTPVHAKEQAERQKSDYHLQNRVEVIDQRILPGVHAHQDHRVVLVLCRIEKIGVYEAANHRQKQQDVQEYRVFRQLLIKDADAANHRDKVKELADEGGGDFPQGGQRIREDFQAPDPIERRRQQAL